MAIANGRTQMRRRPVTPAGLLRYRRVVHAYAECLEQTAVCRHVITGAQHDHIAGDEIVSWNDDDCTVTLRSDLMWQQALERRHRLLGPVLLPEREEAVDDDHAHDRHRKRRHSLDGHLKVSDQSQNCRHPRRSHRVDERWLSVMRP